MNIKPLIYAAKEEALFEANLAMNGVGYTRKTTFYSDLSIAECFGEKSIKDTFKSVCKHWIDSYKDFTEFVLCLNYKCWEFNDRGNDALCELYGDLFYKAKDLFYEHFEGNEEALHYFFEVTD